MRNLIIADTGYFSALANPKDYYHQQALLVSQNMTYDLITTWPVITETCHYLIKKVSPKAQALLLSEIKVGLVQIAEIKDVNLNKMVALILKYSDLPMDLADASLIILAEELGHGRILSTDRRDFKTYRWKNHKPFQNLLLPEL